MLRLVTAASRWRFGMRSAPDVAQHRRTGKSRSAEADAFRLQDARDEVALALRVLRKRDAS